MLAALTLSLVLLPSATPADTARPRIAIAALTAAGLPEEFAVGLTETIATEVARTDVFDTISPKQIQSLLAYEKRREALGDCREEACYTQVAKLVRAEHLIAGSVARVGEDNVLNLVLIDSAKGVAIERTNRKTKDGSELMSEAQKAVIALLQPVLGARQGYLKIGSNVPDADIVLDDDARPERPGQVIELAAGPHTVQVKRDGFYPASTIVRVQPGRLMQENLTLIPAKETIQAYEAKASLMRYGAYASGVLAVAAGVVGAVFYSKATDDKVIVDSFGSALQIEQADPMRRGQAIDAREGFVTNQALYLSGLGTAIAAGATSLFLFVVGDDPDRYEEFDSLVR